MNDKFCRMLSIINLLRIIIIVSTLLAASLFIDAFTSKTSAQTEENSKEVIAQVERYQNLWNTHDAAALAEFFTEDADFIMGNLPLINGRGEIQNWWQNYFDRQESERSITIDVNSLRIIAVDVALINVSTTTGGKDSQDKELIIRKARGTWVMLKKNGVWFITAMRGMPTEEDQIIRNFDNRN